MTGRIVVRAVLAISAVSVMAASNVSAKGPRLGRATLEGFQEIPTLSTAAGGSLRVAISPAEDELTYTLRYDGFDTNILQAHIHLGRPAFNGGIMVFQCTNLTPPAGVPVPPACPLVGGTVTGTLTAADVVGPTGQGIAAGQFDEVVAALRAEAAYGNVHTTKFPGGEIRGQVRFEGSGRERERD